MSNAERIVLVEHRKRVYDGFFKVDQFTISHSKVNSDALVESVVREVFERGDSASILLHNIDNDTVILAEQFRMPTYEKGPGWLVETIAGSIEPGETAEECIRRELLEEVGYEIREIEMIARFYASPGGSSERIVLFYAQVTSKDLKIPEASGLHEQGEDVRRVEVGRSEFLEGVRNGRYEDAKLLVAGFWLAGRS